MYMNTRVQYIKKDDLINDREYYCLSRNFEICTWDGSTFIGERYKFGNTFLCEDQHWDEGGTVKPLAILSIGDK